MTIINQKSISGITSITFASAGDDLLTFHSNNGTERFRIDNSGNTKITAGIVTTLTVTGNGTVGGTLGVTGDVDVADKIVHTGDTDTAIRFPAADTFTVETSGSERVRVTSAGRMGLGCTPDTTADFHIRNSNAANLKLGGSGTDATGFSFNYSNSGNTTTTIKQHYRATSASALLHIDTGTFTLATGTSNTERLRIDSSGNVGIGTDSVSAGLHVVTDVNPVLKLDRGTANTANANLYYNGTLTGQLSAANTNFQLSAVGASTPMSFYVNGSERMRILSSGGLTFNGDTAAANALDDYEEGTFTAVLEGSSTAGSPTYGNQSGTYTKIGRLVTCFVNMSITNKGSMAGDVRISGLPFNVDDVISGTGVDGGGFVNYYASIADSAIVGFGLLPDQNTDNATFYFRKEGVSMGGLEPADINNNFQFRAVITYCHAGQ